MVDEFLGLAYQREYGLPVVVFRLFNTVGPRQVGRYGMVIPRFVQQALNGGPVTVYGDGEQSRCFLHVSDAVRAITALAETPEAIGQVVNVGSTEEYTITELARRVLSAVDGKPSPKAALDQRITYIPYDQAYAEGFDDMRRRVPDISRVQALTGWRPSLSMEQILQDVIQEYRNRA
jgi:UDP-glucose 4-epimerase